MFLFMDKAKESGFKRLLEAGAASVVVETELSCATHAFVDTARLKSAGNVSVILCVVNMECVACTHYIHSQHMHYTCCARTHTHTNKHDAYT